jgi:hypothetical protein
LASGCWNGRSSIADRRFSGLPTVLPLSRSSTILGIPHIADPVYDIP